MLHLLAGGDERKVGGDLSFASPSSIISSPSSRSPAMPLQGFGLALTPSWSSDCLQALHLALGLLADAPSEQNFKSFEFAASIILGKAFKI